LIIIAVKTGIQAFTRGLDSGFRQGDGVSEFRDNFLAFLYKISADAAEGKNGRFRNSLCLLARQDAAADGCVYQAIK
jgi:hypothetical protein